MEGQIPISGELNTQELLKSSTLNKKLTGLYQEGEELHKGLS